MKNSSLYNILLLSNLFVLPISSVYADNHFANDAIIKGHIAVQNAKIEHELLQQKIKASQAEKDYQNQQAALRARASSQQNKRIQAPTQKQINELADMITSDEAKDTINYLDNLKPDPYEPRKLDPVNMDGFDTELKPQQSNFKYSFER